MPTGYEYVDTCETIERGGWKFQPLIREKLALRGGLKINFLRKEAPGKIYQGGDLDNRIKTLLDALQVPNHDQVIKGAPDALTHYCLFEDDGLLAGLNIETNRLLSRPGASEHEVRLIIEVDVRVMQSRFYNQPFLGG